jgi:hypothetical protein
MKAVLKDMSSSQWPSLLNQFSNRLEHSFWHRISADSVSMNDVYHFRMFIMYWIMFLRCASRQCLVSSLSKQIESTVHLIEDFLCRISALSIDDNDCFRSILYLWLILTDAFDWRSERYTTIRASILTHIVRRSPNFRENCLGIRLLRSILLANESQDSEETTQLIRTFWEYLDRSLLILGWSGPIYDYHFIYGGPEDSIIFKTYALDTLIHGFRQLIDRALPVPSLLHLIARCIVAVCMAEGHLQNLGWSLLRNEILFESTGLTDHIALVCMDYLRSSIDLSDQQLSDIILNKFIRIIDILSVTVNRKAEYSHLSELLKLLLDIETILGDGSLATIARSKLHMFIDVLLTNGLCPRILFPYFIHLEKLLTCEVSPMNTIRINAISHRIAKAWSTDILKTGIDLDERHLVFDLYSKTSLGSKLRISLFRTIIFSLVELIENR